MDMLTAIHRRSRLLAVALLGLFLSGCVSRPTPAYRKVDRDTPEFKAAVAREAELQQAKGKSVSAAEEIASRKVVQQTIQTEKDRRTDLVAPLVGALASFDRPRNGCWAFVLSTTTRKAGVTTVVVERFDPFQPEERLWTLLNVDGHLPGEKAQADYRTARLRAWKKEQKRRPPKYTNRERVESSAIHGAIDITRPDPVGPATFTFIRDHMHVALLGDIPRARETYQIDAAAQNVRQHTQTHLESAEMLGGSVKFDAFDQSTDYLIIEPALPPFIARSLVHYRASFFGHDTGDVTIERAYSDYHRVKCYDDRFEVKIGEPTMTDFLP